MFKSVFNIIYIYTYIWLLSLLRETSSKSPTSCKNREFGIRLGVQKIVAKPSVQSLIVSGSGQLPRESSGVSLCRC